MANIPSAKLITSDALISYVINAMVLCVDLTLLHWSENTTSTTLHALPAQRYLGRKIAITSTTVRSIATTTTLLSLHKDAMDVKRQFLSSLLRFFEMGKINIGILNAT